jgi:hypothetical protein
MLTIFRTPIILKKLKNFLLNINFYLYINPKFKKTNHSTNFIFVTGADSSHVKSALNCINSVINNNCKIIFWDLGCSAKELLLIKASGAIIRKFPYENFPGFYNIKINAGNYAWKPAIIKLSINEFRIPVFWFDAGNLLQEHIRLLKTTIVNGFYSPYSVKRVFDLTFPTVIKKFSSISNVTNKRNLNGACVCFDPNHDNAMNLLNDWEFYAKDIEYIAPPGSSRINHRQDQSLLTLLAYHYDMVKKIPHGYLDFSIHNDVE